MGMHFYVTTRRSPSPTLRPSLHQEPRPRWGGRRKRPVQHGTGTATFLAFVLAGSVPLLPYALGASLSVGLFTSVLLTFLTLFAVGASRALVTVSRWWVAGIEVLALGIGVALVAYFAGALVIRLGGVP